jgi:hypothetical protein
MPTVDELLAKQAKRLQRLQEKEVEEKPPLRLERQGPTRPWQEHLPQYQHEGVNSSVATSGNGCSVEFSTTHAQHKTAQELEPASVQSWLQAADSKVTLVEAADGADLATPARVIESQKSNNTRERLGAPRRAGTGEALGTSNTVGSENNQAEMQELKTRGVGACRESDEKDESKAYDLASGSTRMPHASHSRKTRLTPKDLAQQDARRGINSNHTTAEPGVIATQRNGQGGSDIPQEISSYSADSGRRRLPDKSPVTTGSQNSNASLTQKKSNRGAAMAQKDPNHGSTMAQKDPNHGSTMAQKDPNHGSTMAQKDPNHGSIAVRRDNARKKAPSRRRVKPLTMAQKSDNHGSIALQDTDLSITMAHKELVQTNLDSPVVATMAQKSDNHGSEEPNHGSVEKELESLPEGKTTGQSTLVKRILPRQSTQLELLKYLASLADSATLETPLLSRRQMASNSNMGIATVNINLKRLVKKGLVKSVRRDFSPTAGGATYRVPRWVLKLLSDKLQTMGQKPTNHGSEAHVSSSSLDDLKNYNDKPQSDSKIQKRLRDDRERSEKIEVWVVRLRMEELGISALQLQKVARDWLGTWEDFENSLQHIAFYVRTAAASNIRSKASYIMSELRSGYVGRPSDFVSWEDEIAECKRLDQVRQNLERRVIRLKAMEADFDSWLEELTYAQREKILSEVSDYNSDFPAPPAVQDRVLRTRFATLRNCPEFVQPANSDT